VPGKVLGSGTISHNVTVAAFAFSQNAKKQIESAKGKTMTINELLRKNPKGKDIRIIG
jgi:large subunit ribosomal protein L18e